METIALTVLAWLAFALGSKAGVVPDSSRAARPDQSHPAQPLVAHLDRTSISFSALEKSKSLREVEGLT